MTDSPCPIGHLTEHGLSKRTFRGAYMGQVAFDSEILNNLSNRSGPNESAMQGLNRVATMITGPATNITRGGSGITA